jgi:hypothetical protein
MHRVKTRRVCFAIALLAASCTSEPTDDDIDQAYESSRDELSDASFEDVGDSGQCTNDCSGHEAGFDWARDQGVADVSECSGSSQSFVEGCEAYASAIESGAQEELESGE